MGLLSRCSLFVGNDSGPLHLATALGVATVSIFWCGNLLTAGPLNRARHRPDVSWRLDCPQCGRDTIYDACTHQVSFVADISVAEVAAQALDLLRSEQMARPSHRPEPFAAPELGLPSRRTKGNMCAQGVAIRDICAEAKLNIMQ